MSTHTPVPTTSSSSAVPVPTSATGPTDRSNVLIVGAGVAGLAAALTASAAGCRVLVLDAHPVGGRARTTDHGGFLHNVGPHALYRGGALSHLLAQHGITVTGGPPPEVPAHVVRDGAAHRLALSPVSMMRTDLLSRRDRVRLLALFARVQRGRPAALVGHTVDEWLGSSPTQVRQFVDMLIRLSTYTDAPDLFDAGAALAQLQLAIGSGVQYVDDGWGSIIDAMVGIVATRGGEVRTGVEVTAIEVGTSTSRDVTVTTTSGVVRAAAVVVAAGGPDVAARLTATPVAGADRITSPVTASVLDLSIARATPVVAFALDAPLYLSAHAPAARLAPAGRGLISVMRYHRPGADLPAPSSARDELRGFAALAGIDPGDVVHERWSHRLVVAHGAPTADGGGLAGRPATTALGRPGVYLAGDWVGAEGLLADAAASSGVQAATDALAHRASISV